MMPDPASFDFEIYDGKEGAVEITQDNGAYRLRVHGHQWLFYDNKSRGAALEGIAHCDLATGKVIVTGLGLGLREQLILTKLDVTELHILEQSKDLINFHLKRSKWINDPRITIVNTDANTHKDSCDVLLLDHYEQESAGEIIRSVKQVANNITSDVLWFWPLERYITSRAIKRWIPLQESYRTLLEDMQIPRLPDLSLEQLTTYCRAHSHRLNRVHLR